MRRPDLKHLEDIRQATQHILDYTKDKTLDDFDQSRQLRDAVYMNFILIGEALNALRKSNPALAESFTEWSRIIGFRNQVAHGYFELKHGITWNIITAKLPLLLQEVQTRLRST